MIMSQISANLDEKNFLKIEKLATRLRCFTGCITILQWNKKGAQLSLQNCNANALLLD